MLGQYLFKAKLFGSKPIPFPKLPIFLPTFLDPIFFETKNLLGPNKILDPTFFGPRILFGPNSFIMDYSLGP